MLKHRDQVISSTGDEQRCRQLLAAAAEDLKGCIADLAAVLEEGETIKFRGHDDELFRGSGGMLHPRSKMDTLGPRLYEEVVWAQVLRKELRPIWLWVYDPWRRSRLRTLVGRLRILSRWAQIRTTPGVEIELHISTAQLAVDDRSRTYWVGELTVAADGVVQLSSSDGFCLPANEDNLRAWIARCNAEVSAELLAALRARKDQKEIAELQTEMASQAAELARELAEEQAEMAKRTADEQAEIYQLLAEQQASGRLSDK